MNKAPGAASSTPLQDGFSWPAEWEMHRRTWMCWPTRLECFGGESGLLRAKQAYARVARAIAAFEPVRLVACAGDVEEARLATGGEAEIVEIPIDDSWARDSGPTFLKDGAGRLSGVQWIFNAWGGKYSPYTNDARLAGKLLQLAGAGVYPAPLVCEGGALHGDGRGTVLTTEQCLLNPNRNSHYSRSAVEDILKLFLGARTVIWLGGGFSDAETDGHVDNIACFAGVGRVVLGMPGSRQHPDYDAVREAKRRLSAARDAAGNALEIIELPQPKNARNCWRGQPLAMSYVNFYFANGAVLMPGFDDPNDEEAHKILGQCFPEREIIQLDATDIVQGGGGIHCITQQEPAV